MKSQNSDEYALLLSEALSGNEREHANKAHLARKKP